MAQWRLIRLGTVRLRVVPWPRSVGWGSGIAVSFGVGRRHGSYLALLWLWLGPAAAAPIGPLAWELPYAEGAALKRQKDKKRIVFSTDGAGTLGYPHAKNK